MLLEVAEVANMKLLLDRKYVIDLENHPIYKPLKEKTYQEKVSLF